jgi:hypothetical protein
MLSVIMVKCRYAECLILSLVAPRNNHCARAIIDDIDNYESTNQMLNLTVSKL